MPSSTTPQALRGSITTDDPRRSLYDSELWDDLANVIYAVKDVTLTIKTIIDTRIWITAQGKLNAAGTLTINVDAVAQTPATTVGGAVTAVVNTYADIKSGTHTITITSGASITEALIMVRRGRKPGTNT